MGLLGLLGDMLADRKVRRLLRTAPAATLDALAENTFACVTGTVDMLDARALEAPLSGRLCAYYSIVILARYRGTAEELGSEQEGIPFTLRDGTATAIIDPAHATISSGFDHKVDLPSSDVADERQRALMVRHARTRWAPGELLFREAILGVGERIAVYGAAMREPIPESGGEQGYRDGGATQLRFTGTARFPLVLSDDPKSVR